MSRKPDDLDLEYIHQIAKGNSKVQDLITAKNHQEIELQNKQFVKYKTPDFSPKPEGDIRLSKIHIEKRADDKTLNALIEHSNSNFDNRIKQEMDKIVESSEHEAIRPYVRQMSARDLSILSEKGVEAYKIDKEHNNKSIAEAIKLDFDDKSQFGNSLNNLEFMENSKDLGVDKHPTPTEDFE